MAKKKLNPQKADLSIRISDSSEPVDRGGFNVAARHGDIDAQLLRERIRKFLEAMQVVVNGVPRSLGSFHVDSVTLTAEVSVEGSISLLGTGGKLAGKGGLSFTLKPKGSPIGDTI